MRCQFGRIARRPPCWRRPTGNQSRPKAKTASISMPSQNSGVARVASTIGIDDRLEQAAALPGEQRAEKRAERRRRRSAPSWSSSSVFGSTASIRPSTGWRWRKERPELALARLREIDEVLLGQRPVEAELLQHQLALLVGEGRVDIGGRSGRPASAGTSGTGWWRSPTARTACAGSVGRHKPRAPGPQFAASVSFTPSRVVQLAATST